MGVPAGTRALSGGAGSAQLLLPTPDVGPVGRGATRVPAAGVDGGPAAAGAYAREEPGHRRFDRFGAAAQHRQQRLAVLGRGLGGGSSTRGLQPLADPMRIADQE